MSSGRPVRSRASRDRLVVYWSLIAVVAGFLLGLWLLGSFQ